MKLEELKLQMANGSVSPKKDYDLNISVHDNNLSFFRSQETSVTSVTFHPDFDAKSSLADIAVGQIAKPTRGDDTICISSDFLGTYFGSHNTNESLQVNWMDYNWDIDAVNDELAYLTRINTCCPLKKGDPVPRCFLPGSDQNLLVHTVSEPYLLEIGVRRHGVTRLLKLTSTKPEICPILPIGLPEKSDELLNDGCDKNQECKEVVVYQHPKFLLINYNHAKILSDNRQYEADL